jgi:hypothetical protein
MHITPRTRTLIAVGLPVLGLAIFLASLLEYREAGRHLTPASVSVSGYYRRDGTYVGSYNRRPPGGVAHDAPYERKRSLCQGGMFLGIAISLAPLILYFRNKQEKAQKPRAVPTPPSDVPSSPVNALGVRFDSKSDGAEFIKSGAAHSVGDSDMPIQSVQSPTAVPIVALDRSEPAISEVIQTLVLMAPDPIVKLAPPEAEKSLTCAACACVLRRHSQAFLQTETQEDFIVEQATGSAYCLPCSEIVKYCNCAACGKLLKTDDLAGRIMGRPYCETCLEPHILPARRGGPMEEVSPWQEIAIRQLEDA